MSTATLPTPASSAPPRNRILGLTVDQYDCLIEQGQIAEGAPVELLDGQMVLKDRSHLGEDPMSVGELHASGVTRLGKLVIDLAGTGAAIRCQQPIAIPPAHEPEPDGAIVIDVGDEYENGHPRPADVFCLFEVSDSSLDLDRTTKARIYAAAGVPLYVIVNIPDRRLERHADPIPGGAAYKTIDQVEPGQTLRLPLGNGRVVEIAANRLIPGLR